MPAVCSSAAYSYNTANASSRLCWKRNYMSHVISEHRGLIPTTRKGSGQYRLSMAVRLVSMAQVPDEKMKMSLVISL